MHLLDWQWKKGAALKQLQRLEHSPHHHILRDSTICYQQDAVAVVFAKHIYTLTNLHVVLTVGNTRRISMLSASGTSTD